jgi:hypothetical protein
VSAGGGYWYIQNYYSGLVLDVPNGSTKIGTPIQQYPYNGGDNQLWYFIPISTYYYGSYDTAYLIVNKKSGMVLDVPGFSTSNGTIIQQYQRNDGRNQRWWLLPRGSARL